MCGIVAGFDHQHTSSIVDSGSHHLQKSFRETVIDCSVKLRYRGPDASGCYLIDHHNALAHERLAIISPDSGAQPLVTADGEVIVTVNGEIYNYKEILAEYFPECNPLTISSDCEVIGLLYQEVRMHSLCPPIIYSYSFLFADS